MEDREPTPSAAVLDSQSVETATMVNIEVGYDGGKPVKGRKRHLLVDTLGLVVMVVVTAANVNDRDGARRLAREAVSHTPTLAPSSRHLG